MSSSIYSGSTAVSQPFTDLVSGSFEFPKKHDFPPLFTLQTNLNLLAAQKQEWMSIIIAYCRQHKMWKLGLVDACNGELFWNKKINRKLSLPSARVMLEAMVSVNRAEWFSNEKNIAYIYWRNPEEWAQTIYTWIDETGQKNSVLTLYELMEGPATINQEFHGIDPAILNKALDILVKQNKASIFGSEDERGIKFY